MDLVIRTGGEHRISNFLLWQIAYAELYFTDVLWPDFDENVFEGALNAFAQRERRFGELHLSMPLHPRGTLLKYRLITALILIPVVIGALFLLPPVGFAIVTLVVCMLAAWEWGQLAGFASRTQRIWLAILCGFLLVAMLLSLPEYQHSPHHLLVSTPLWLSMGWWVAALMLVLTYPRSAVSWRNSRLLRIIFGILTIIPFFGECLLYASMATSRTIIPALGGCYMSCY